MKIVYPTSSFLFSDDSPSYSKLWGCTLTLPHEDDVSIESPKFLICDKCGAYKTSQGKVCPICHPETPYNSNTKKFIYTDCLLNNNTHEVQSNITGKKSPFSSIVCFAFDISSSSSLYQQIIYTITSNDFQKEFNDYGFIFAFLIKDTTIFITRQDDGISDHLSFDKLPPLNPSNFFTSENLGNALIDAFSIVQVIVLDLYVTERSFSILFSELSKNLFNDSSENSEEKIYLDHLFLFYPFHLLVSKKIKLNLPYSVHCIEINDKKTIEKKYFNRKTFEPEKTGSYDNLSLYQGSSRKERSLDNLKMDSNFFNTSNSINDSNNFDSDIQFSNYDSFLLAFQNGWTHSIISASDVKSIKLIEYIKYCIKPFLPKQLKISLHVSPELEIAWISANKILMPNSVNSKSGTNSNKLKNYATVMVNNFQSDFMLHVTFQPVSKSAVYDKAKYFALQTIFEFSNGRTFISNRSFKKSANIPKNADPSSSHEWSDSINVAPFTMMCIKQRASFFLMSLINSSFYSPTPSHSSFFKRRSSTSSTGASSPTSSSAVLKLTSPSSSTAQSPITSNNQIPIIPTGSPSSSAVNALKSKMLTGKPLFNFNWSINGQTTFSGKFNNSDLWDVNFTQILNNQNSSTPSLSIVGQIVELFTALLIDDASPLNEMIRVDIIYMTMTQGYSYFISLFNSLFTLLNSKSETLYLPPFFFVSKLNEMTKMLQAPDLGDKNQDKVVLLSTIRIELNEEEIQAISNIITNIKRIYKF